MSEDKNVVAIRFRAIAVGAVLIPAAAFWVFGGEMGGAVRRYTFATWAAPFYNAVFILLVLTILNLPLRRLAPSHALRPLELLAVYAMVSVGSAVVSTDFQGILVTLMGYPTYFADGFNNWDRTFADVLPRWLIVTDRAALTGFYKGYSTLYTFGHLKAWLKPILPWTLFIWALLAMMLSVNVILRRAWMDRERLTFPIVALPMALAEQPEQFFKNRLMWIGFALAGGITLINGINYLYPAMVYIPVKRADYLVAESGPLAGLGYVRISFYFFAITLGFLMPQDLSFSIYIFYFLHKLSGVVVQLLGTPPESGFPYYSSQAFGAYMAIFCVAVWGLKKHLRTVWNTALGRTDQMEDADEPVRYRTALLVFGAASVFLLVFAIAAGMAAWVAFLFFGIYLALSVMITRIRAEFGFPVHDMHFMGPDQVMQRIAGTGPFDRQTMGVFSLFYWFNRVYRSHPMPHQLEALRMAGSERGARRGMFAAVLTACLIAVPVCFWVYLHGFYQYGAATANFNQWSTGFGREAFSRLDSVLSTPKPPEFGEAAATGFGFGFALLLAMLRRSFVGFPFHPLAYAVSNSWGVMNLWLPIMIGSWCKWAVLRGSGLRGYRRAMMFFFGLMLGEFAVGCSWTLLGLFTGIPTYDFWP